MATAKRLNLAEKSWTKLAKHFSIQISDRDTKDLIEIQKFTESWKQQMDEIRIDISQKEKQARQSLQHIRLDLDKIKSSMVPNIV